MTSKTLVGAVGAVIIIVTGAYFVISPLVRAPGADSVSQTDTPPEAKLPQNQDSVDTASEVDTRGDGSVDDDSDDSADDDIQAVPVETTPTPVPAPSPIPEPKPTGYTATEVTKHATKASCWTIINGTVYDITSYVPRHPGGEKNILKICGKDGSSLFEGQHGGDSKPEAMLEKLKIGDLI